MVTLSDYELEYASIPILSSEKVRLGLRAQTHSVGSVQFPSHWTNQNGLAILAIENLFPEFEVNKTFGPEENAALDGVINILKNGAPDYWDWIRMVVQHVVPLTPPANKACVSGSSEQFKGTIGLSLPSYPFAIIEALVHEAAHQHFYLANDHLRLFEDHPFLMGYSPVLRRARPLGKIFLAYHALANSLLCLRTLKENPQYSSVIPCSQVLNLSEMTADLGNQLVNSTGLTSVGRRMFVRIRECIISDI